MASLRLLYSIFISVLFLVGKVSRRIISRLLDGRWSMWHHQLLLTVCQGGSSWSKIMVRGIRFKLLFKCWRDSKVNQYMNNNNLSEMFFRRGIIWLILLRKAVICSTKRWCLQLALELIILIDTPKIWCRPLLNRIKDSFYFMDKMRNRTDKLISLYFQSNKLIKAQWEISNRFKILNRLRMHFQLKYSDRSIWMIPELKT